MKKIKVVLNYNVGDADGLAFEEVDGEFLGEMIGQESALEIMNSLDELDKKAKVILVDENDKILKSKLVKIAF